MCDRYVIDFLGLVLGVGEVCVEGVCVLSECVEGVCWRGGRI